MAAEHQSQDQNFVTQEANPALIITRRDRAAFKLAGVVDRLAGRFNRTTEAIADAVVDNPLTAFVTEHGAAMFVAGATLVGSVAPNLVNAESAAAEPVANPAPGIEADALTTQEALPAGYTATYTNPVCNGGNADIEFRLSGPGITKGKGFTVGYSGPASDALHGFGNGMVNDDNVAVASVSWYTPKSIEGLVVDFRVAGDGPADNVFLLGITGFDNLGCDKPSGVYTLGNTGPGPQANPEAGPPSDLKIVDPRRILDTRETHQTLGPNGEITLDIDSLPGLPADAKVTGVVLNITATNTLGPGFISAYPTGGARPEVSNVNVSAKGQSIGNTAFVRLGVDGKVTIFTQPGGDIIADLVGILEESQAGEKGGHIQFLPPQRTLDTRTSAKQVLGAGEFIHIPFRGQPGIPLNASAVILNVTATEATEPGFTTIYPDNMARPNTSALNPSNTERSAAALVIAKLGVEGVELYTFKQAGYVVDLVGVVVEDTGTSGRVIPITPYRAMDTRQVGGKLRPTEQRLIDDSKALAAAGISRELVAGVVGNATAIAPIADAFLAVKPFGNGELISSLNVDMGKIRPNLTMSAERPAISSNQAGDAAYDVQALVTA